MALENNTEATTSEPFSAEKYFATQPPPPTLEEDVERVRDFVRKHQAAKRKVVLVTVRVALLITTRCRIADLVASWLTERGHDCAIRAQCVRRIACLSTACG